MGNKNGLETKLILNSNSQYFELMAFAKYVLLHKKKPNTIIQALL